MTANSGQQALLLDGREAARSLRENLGATLAAEGGPDVTLATVMVGEDEASERYIRMRDRQADNLGLRTRLLRLPADIAQADLEEAVRELVADPEVHGIIVQLPLPGGLDADAVTGLVPPEKDIDGLTEGNLGRLVRGVTGLIPCTPLGVMRLIGHYGIPTEGRRAVIVGRSTVVGLPLTLLLSARGADATVTLAHSRTPDLATVTREADILVAAAGSPGLITAEHIKPGAAVFDVGMTPTDAGIEGDVDFNSVQEVAGAVTPNPGGTGPMTVACVLENTVKAARLQGRLPAE
ncbi:bifunctional 5,10-methylenetetrahydrofolate dehydrogenase/5,10-methenyltetrahydrofolate cyclohydrolase [Thiohalorhabdus sp. Cl-TMA]|uniref:Bifunctional protein FolD n=1 Tax=Thiohalorhabdus methylotrophus TaxID=3242694 RepID=A0ABV4TYM3_9GAMM